MTRHVDVDTDAFESIGTIADRVVRGSKGEKTWDGTPIWESGIYRGIPMEAYHGQLTVEPSISSSGLRTIESQSPLHYWATSYLNPDRPDQTSSAAMDFGRAVHTLLLSEDGFRDQYVVRPEQYPDWRTKEAKGWRDAMLGLGKTILTDNQVTDINGMADRLSKNQVAVDLLRGRIERSIVVKDKAGVYVKSRPDSIPAESIIADLKTCASADQLSISRSITGFGYLQQMALAITSLEAVGPSKVDEAVLLFVETSYPYAFNIKPLDNGDIYTAMRLNRRAIDTFAECLKANDWPTYPDSTFTWSAPKWWSDRHENDRTLPEIQRSAA